MYILMHMRGACAWVRARVLYLRKGLARGGVCPHIREYVRGAGSAHTVALARVKLHQAELRGVLTLAVSGAVNARCERSR